MAFSVLRMGKKLGLVVAPRINPSAAYIRSDPLQVKHQMATITQGLLSAENKQGLPNAENTQGLPNGENTQGLPNGETTQGLPDGGKTEAQELYGRLIRRIILVSVAAGAVAYIKHKRSEIREQKEEIYRQLLEVFREEMLLSHRSRETTGIVEAHEGQKVYPRQDLAHKIN